jgi:uncharacterized protein (DUF1697 family)
MQRYIAIIRGINVGGHNKVSMQVLRDALTKKKLSDVQTYIQSGNVIFSATDADTTAMEKLIRKVLLDTFSVDVQVIVRDQKEWKQTIKKNPFLSETDDETKLLVTFLSEKPDAAAAKTLAGVTFQNDSFQIIGKDIYLFCREGYGKSKIPNMFFEKKLGVSGTTRNWRTVLELGRMAAGI